MNKIDLLGPLYRPLLIRASADGDVPAMLEIYRHHIRQGIGDLGAYEEEPFAEEDLKQRRKSMRKHRLPHLVAEVDGEVVGYAYAVPFRKRPAYRFALKHSIYIREDVRGLGIGRRLLPALVEACAVAGFRQMIGYIDANNTPSLRLHETCGFEQVGLLKSVAFKFGRWADSVIVQRMLGEGDANTPVPWPE